MSDKVREWINGDESAKEMLARVFTERPMLMLSPPLHRLPLRAGNILEISGPSPSAKTHILIQAAVNCILPTEWNGVHYGGLGRLVLYIDLDCRFETSRLLEILKYRIAECSRQNNMGRRCNDKPSTPDENELLYQCMKRFLYIRCYDTLEFLATLKTLHYQLQMQRESHGVRSQLLLIDNIGTFHWVDRASSASSLRVHNRKRFSLQNVWDIAVQDLRKLLYVHPMLVIASKATILGSTVSVAERLVTAENIMMLDSEVKVLPALVFIIICYRNKWYHSVDISNSRNEMEEEVAQKLQFREYMPSVWQSFVTHRILVQPSGVRKQQHKEEEQTLYISEWLQPSLGFSDKFIVGDSGISIAS